MIRDDFVSKEKIKYKRKIGKTLASALTGLIVGFLVTVFAFVPFLLRYCQLWMQNKGF